MNYFNSISNYIPSVETVNNWIFPEKITNTTQKHFDEVISYEDASKEGKNLSSTHVYRTYPTADCKTYKHHPSLRDLCKDIALQRNPAATQTLEKETSSASFSSKNRGDLRTETTLSPELKEILGLQGKTDKEIKSLLKIETLYNHNSEFNGHSYINRKGELVKINTAIESSADRKALRMQNLSALKGLGTNLLFTGRPDTLEKAKEQALFMLSHIDGTKGLNWNESTQCVEFPYVVYSIMSDSSALSAKCKLTNTPGDNEKQFLLEEMKTLRQLSKEPILIKDAKGNTIKLQCKPILLSQSFNSFSPTLKGFVGEGSLSPKIMIDAYKELQGLLAKNPNLQKKLQPYMQEFKAHIFGDKKLSDLHLFLHINMILSELNGENEELPLALHCKSSTDRTGIGAAIITTLKQLKSLGEEIPSDMSLLTKSPKFKELFALNWIPTWHQRSEYSRDVPGISFGSGISQNPIVIECLPERYLTKSNSKSRWLASSLFAGVSFIAQFLYQLPNVAISILPSGVVSEERRALARNITRDVETLSYLPHIYVNEKGLQFKSKEAHPPSPLQKEEKNK